MRDELLVCSAVLILVAGCSFLAPSAVANVAASPRAINFGSVNVHQNSSTTIVLTNDAQRPAIVERVSSGLAQFVVGGPVLPLTLQSHQSAAFQVVFDPDTASTISGTVIFTFAIHSGSRLIVPVTGTGVAVATPTYLLFPSASSLPFSNTLVGNSSSQSVTLSNTGNSSVTISQISLTGAGFTDSSIALPLTLAAGQNASFSVNFSPTVTGTSTGSISVVSNASNSPATISLSATAVQPQIAIAPAGVNFGSVTDGTTSSQTITVQNSGSANLSITQVSITGSGFTDSGLALPLTIAPGASSSFTLSFAPTTASTSSGNLTFLSNAPNSSSSVALLGTGTAPKTYLLVPSSSSLSFASTLVGSSSIQPITLSNTGNSSVTISQLSMTGSTFSSSGITLPATVAAGQSISFSTVFTPTVTGSSTGSISVVSNATNSPAAISLSGTAVQPQIAVIPASVSFGSVTNGTTNTQTITVQNSGTANLTVTQVSLTGSGFATAGVSLPVTIAPGASASFTLSFSPTNASTSAGTLTFASNAATPSFSVPVSGTGVAQSLQISASATSLSFGSQTLSTSASQSVTITNTGNSSVTISQVSVSGTGFSYSGIAIPLILSVGQATTCNAIFDPTTAGTFSGSMTVVSNATNSPLSIALSGTGSAPVTHAVSLSWQPSTSTVVGYNVYQGSESGGPYTKVNSNPVAATNYSDTNVVAGDTYYFVTTAVDSGGNESAYSNQATAVIP